MIIVYCLMTAFAPAAFYIMNELPAKSASALIIQYMNSLTTYVTLTFALKGCIKGKAISKTAVQTINPYLQRFARAEVSHIRLFLSPAARAVIF
jgi:hypothetical protein